MTVSTRAPNSTPLAGVLNEDRRFVAVTRDELEYYHSELEHRNHDPLGTIYLKNIGSVIPYERKASSEAFEFVVSSSSWVKKDVSKKHREFYFAASSEEERDEWITTIEFLKTTAVHRSFQSTFGAKLTIPLHFDDPVVNLFDRKQSLSTVQSMKPIGDPAGKVSSTMQRRQTVKGLTIANIQGQTTHKAERDIKECIKGMFNYMFVHLAGHMMEHSFRAKPEYRRVLSQTPRILEQNRVMETIETKYPALDEMQLNVPSPSGSIFVSTAEPTPRANVVGAGDRKRLEMALAFRGAAAGGEQPAGAATVMSRIKEEKIEDDETCKLSSSKNEMTLARQQSVEEKHEHEESSAPSISDVKEPRKGESVPEADPKEEVKGVVDESVVESDREDDEDEDRKSVNPSKSSSTLNQLQMPSVPASVGKERKSLKDSEDTTLREGHSSKRRVRPPMERTFSMGTTQLHRKSIVDARKLSILTSKSSLPKHGSRRQSNFGPAQKSGEDIVSILEDDTKGKTTPGDLVVGLGKARYEEAKDSRYVGFEEETKLHSQSNEIASVVRIDVRRRDREEVSISKMQMQLHNKLYESAERLREQRNSGTLEGKGGRHETVREEARILAEVQRFVMKKFFPQTARAKKTSEFDSAKRVASTVTPSSNTLHLSPTNAGRADAASFRKSVQRVDVETEEEKKDDEEQEESENTITLTDYKEDELLPENLDRNPLEEEYSQSGDMRAEAEANASDIRPVQNLAPGDFETVDSPIAGNENGGSKQPGEGKRYGFVVRHVQSLGGDIFELRENTLVMVQKVNEDDGIVTCAWKDLVGLFPLDAIKIGNAVMPNEKPPPTAKVAEAEEQIREVSISLRESEGNNA